MWIVVSREFTGILIDLEIQYISDYVISSIALFTSSFIHISLYNHHKS